MSADLRLCIDFGTAFSKAVVARTAPSGRVDPNSIQPLPIGRVMGEPSALFAPGAVFIRDDGQAFFASSARQQARECGNARREILSSFKTFLSDHDLSAGLQFRAPKEIDPTGEYCRGDLVILFLAWVMRAVDLALQTTDANGPRPPIRYTTPAWNRPPTMSAVARLFDDALFVAEQLGPALNLPEGLPLATGLAATRAARGRTAFESAVEGAALEAVAAALCHAEEQADATHLLVFDMGAGTTDVAALRLDSGGVTEIGAARQTLSVAGDDLDHLVLNLFLPRSRKNSQSANASRWSESLIAIKPVKHELFRERRAAIVSNGRAKSAHLSDLVATRDFKDLEKTLSGAYRTGLEATMDAAARDGVRQVHVVLAGGGAHLPFVQRMIRQAQPNKQKTRVTILPIAPAWADAPRFGGNLTPLFPQLAVAIGGASAPTNLLTGLMS